MTKSVDPGLSLTWRFLRYWRLLAIAASVLAADQATKAWIASRLPFNTYGDGTGAIRVVRGLFYIVHVGNTGAAWSMFSGRSVVLATLAAATLVAIFIGRRALGLVAPRAQVCFGLMCGGIAGNLTDRLARGHVVDFLDFHFGSYVYPTFNVADSAICIGVVLYAAYSLKSPKSPV
jgi:signal peptidase II